MPKISNLSLKASVDGADSLAIVDSVAGDTKKIAVAAIMPTGCVLDFAGTTAPAGFLLCYGQTLNADVNDIYQPLYDAIGNTYGGTSNTDFVVPDLRGRTAAGRDDMGGSSANRLTDKPNGLNGDVLGDTGGEETHVLTKGELPSFGGGTSFHGGGPGGATVLASVSGDFVSTGSNSSYRSGGGNIGGSTSHYGFNLNIGSNTPHNTVQPTIILNKIIKL